MLKADIRVSGDQDLPALTAVRQAIGRGIRESGYQSKKHFLITAFNARLITQKGGFMGKALEIVGALSVFIGIGFLPFNRPFAVLLSINGLIMYVLGAIYIKVDEIKNKIK